MWYDHRPEALISGNPAVRKKQTGGVLSSRYPGRDAGSELAVKARRRVARSTAESSTSLTDVTRIAPYEVLHEAQSVCCFVEPVAQTRRTLDHRQIALRAFEQRVTGLEMLLCHLSGGKPPIKRLPDLMAVIDPLHSGCRCYCHDGTRSPRCRMPLTSIMTSPNGSGQSKEITTISMLHILPSLAACCRCISYSDQRNPP